MANGETSFQITLPSNASSKLFPENRANSYRTKLYKTLDLGGGGESDWEVALVDIAFPHNWANILESTEIEMVLERIANGPPGSDGGAGGIEVTATSPMGMFTIPKGHYSSVQQLGAIMNSLYQKGLLSSSTPSRAGKQEFFLEFTHDIFTGRARLQYYGNARPPGIQIKFKTKSTYLLSTILGFPFDPLATGKQQINAITTVSSQPPSYTYTLPLESTKRCALEIISSIFVYSNLVRYQMVGDTEAPLLGIVPITTSAGARLGLEANQQYYSFNPPYYIPVLKNQFDTIEIQLNTDWGAPFPFASDDAAVGDDTVDAPNSKVFCRLDFRKRAGAGKTSIFL